MSLEQITEKIKNDAIREAEKVLAKAKSKASEITDKGAKENDAIKDSFAKRFAKEKPEILRRREIVAKLDVKKRMLHSQRNLIQDVYDSALDEMKAFSKNDYLKLCESLLNQSVSSKKEEVLVAENEKFIDEAWINEYNEKKNTNLVISKDNIDISGGFILRSGKIRTNCSWDMLLQVAQEKNESEVVKRLFPSTE
ncbi:MAG: hypothetical protein GXZ18_06085 [Synergistaceae bacterium]|nr:hypothetical protein [Synergistaceae bacterium]